MNIIERFLVTWIIWIWWCLMECGTHPTLYSRPLFDRRYIGIYGIRAKIWPPIQKKLNSKVVTVQDNKMELSNRETFFCKTYSWKVVLYRILCPTWTSPRLHTGQKAVRFGTSDTVQVSSFLISLDAIAGHYFQSFWSWGIFRFKMMQSLPLQASMQKIGSIAPVRLLRPKIAPNLVSGAGC